ncbi:hypothetical protein LHJ74_19715 [Streptomyces sp. N2-109]|uniref:Lipoprotein n=1 Tax=Streptomyces gossypii TaxID=2883101 RepID=A0ABT2JW30_9ACTN|nr:hypothetical protein [Streptomyces gossypii]MCT2592103.1 hypothetical protein [Streptomyces gossypii]
MQMSRSSRSFRRPVSVLAGAVLLATVATGCGPTKAGSAESAVRDALDQLGAKEDATMIAELDGTTDQVHSFLKENGHSLPGRSAVPTRKDARLAARAQLTVSVGADKPLNEQRDASGTRLAAALNFGDRDVFAYKAIGKKIYIRVLLRELSSEKLLTKGDRRAVDDLRDLADELPSSLKAAKSALRGKWVRISPDDFGDFAWAVRQLTGQAGSGARARDATSALDAGAQRDLLDKLGEVLRKDAVFKKAGAGKSGSDGDDDTEQLTATLPARETAARLAPALKPLGVDLRPSEVPDRDITTQLTVRRGELADLSMDLGQLTGAKKSVHLPLRLTFSSGDALSTEAPENPKKLDPQDVLAMVLYRSESSADKKP